MDTNRFGGISRSHIIQKPMLSTPAPFSALNLTESPSLLNGPPASAAHDVFSTVPSFAFFCCGGVVNPSGSCRMPSASSLRRASSSAQVWILQLGWGNGLLAWHYLSDMVNHSETWRGGSRCNERRLTYGMLPRSIICVARCAHSHK